ncbi:DUF2062 domain-containing protein [Calycomorphotria hydatis]|uniref:DUF2062 domain-containing protein n=1 Tax=Calycomorphotria hydatis TaxID=2528027 RepID=A0A517T5N4_9PLAN|nr:DUF2062 domain-containing protein [Calycomorphotria hydatis]QDT63674.1 hypothetical protein V22_08980 [Calycomorphotria hydatis]
MTAQLELKPLTKAERPQFKWWAHPQQLLRYLVSLNDRPHAIALGVAIGMFIGMTPTVGIQMILAGLAWYACKPFFHFNCRAALVAVYVSNPVTSVPIYWFNYCVGCLFVGGDLTREEFAAALTYSNFSEWWATIVGLFIKIGGPLVLGSLVVATITGVATYPATLYLIYWLRGLRIRQRREKSTSSGIATSQPTTRNANEDAA